MKTKAFLFLTMTAFLGACAVQEPEEQKVPFQTYSIEQFLKTVSLGGGYFSPDESKLLVYSNETGI